MAVQNILPDPNHGRDDAGNESSVAANKGPGFKSVSLSSKQNIMTDRTNSGRVLQRYHSYHKWNISITYNPLTKDEFKEVEAFLLQRRSQLKPFFVQLPQYRGQSATATTTNPSNVSKAGATEVVLTNGHTANCAVGDLITFTDSSNTNHKKAYKITSKSAAGSNNFIVITPPLAKEVAVSSTVNLVNPLIKVIQTGDTQQYSLDSKNLYQFSLKLEEVQ